MAVPMCDLNGLQVHVYHLAPEPVTYQNSTDLTFSPTSFVLIAGHHEAVLVDAPATAAQGQAIPYWISEAIPDKTLKAIYITHGHGDHFFSANAIAAAHPEAKILATAGTAEHVAQQYSEPFYTSFWQSLLPGELPEYQVVPEVLLDDKFELEGHVFQVGQGDTYSSTVLHVPDIDLVVGGDVIYGNCHQLFAEDNTPELRAKWLASLDQVAALNPKIVVPSHQRADNGYAPSHVEDTKRYIQFYEETIKTARSWHKLEGALKAKYPDRDGTFILRWSCQAPFGAAF